MAGYNKRNIDLFLSKDFFTFTNSVDPDQMQHYAAFHLGLHCLQKYSFRGFRMQRVKKTEVLISAFVFIFSEN